MSGTSGTRRTRRESRRLSDGWRRWTIIGIVVFVLLDIGLIWWAVAGLRTAPAAASQTPIPIDSFAPAPTYTPTPTETATPAATVTPLTLPSMARQLAALDSAHAWRSSQTQCGGSASLEATSDGGATWTPEPFDADVAGVLGIAVYQDASTVGVVAALAGDCHPEYRLSYTAGQFWEADPDQDPGVTTIDPSTPGSVRNPSGSVPTPCGDVSLATASQGVDAVLCTDASLVIGPADGSSWTPVALPGKPVALDSAGDSSGFVVAERRDPGCVDGIEFAHVGFDRTVTEGTCLSGYADESVPVTISSAGDGSLWLWVGDRVGVSTDGGATFGGLG